jgi:peroxiredoxin
MSATDMQLAEDLAPDFALADSTGVLRSLESLTAARPLVLIFYRGHW